ncbi:hypothetical protein ACFL2H_04230 [Planctomycetota bacterium]
MNSLFSAIGLFLLAGVLVSVRTMRFLHQPGYRSPVGITLTAFTAFMLLWPVIALCSLWYAFTCTYRNNWGNVRTCSRTGTGPNLTRSSSLRGL